MPRRRLEGKIKTLSGAKTVKVEVGRSYHHPRYRKRLRATKSYLAHLEGDRPAPGVPVVIEESRPISARKGWRVVEVAGRPIGPQVEGKMEKVKIEKPKTRGKVRKDKKKK